MIRLRKESAWQFYTSAGGGVGLGPVLVSGGMFVLRDPENNLQQFNYAGSGLGMSFSLPKMLGRPNLSLPQIMLHGHELGATGATADFPSDGIVYVTEACHGPDLTPNQIEGGAVYFDAGVGWLRGYAGTMLIAGMNTTLLQTAVALPHLMGFALSQATVVVLMKGQNEGLQQSAGVDYMLGQVSYHGHYSDGNQGPLTF